MLTVERGTDENLGELCKCLVAFNFFFTECALLAGKDTLLELNIADEKDLTKKRFQYPPEQLVKVIKRL